MMHLPLWLLSGILLASEICGMPSQQQRTSAAVEDPAAAEYGEYFQGDIMEPFVGTFAGLFNPDNHWPGGQVVYKIDSSLPDEIRARVLLAMSRVAQETGGCISFKEWTPLDGIEHVLIKSGSGCSATVGYWTGRFTSINLSERCTVGNIMHELQHSLGVEHQQSRPDRDAYVKINFDNIAPAQMLNFLKESSRYYDSYGLAYDFGSQMHYSLSAFSQNGLDTIEPLPGRVPDGVIIGQRDRMSPSDVALVRAMYKCN